MRPVEASPGIQPPAPSRPLRRFAKFATVGGSGVIVNLAFLRLFVGLLGWALPVASALSIEFSTLSNYLLNRAWTWRDRDRSWWSLLRYHVVTAVGALIQWLVIQLGVTFLHVDYALAAIIGVAIATGWNFVGNHRVAFVEYTPERRRRDLRILLYGASLVVHLVLAAVLAHDWDTFVFQKTVEEFVGNGVTPYATGHAKPDYVYFGVGLPLQPMWYAYPPLPLLLMTATYTPVVMGLAGAPWAARLLIKAPFLASNFLLAFLAHRMVRTAPGDPEERAKKALRVEAFLLFNPLFVFVATIWGMFESLLLSFLVLSVLAMREGRWGRAGAFWGAATLVKIFPLYLVPLLAVHLWRRGGWRAPTRYFLTGGLVFALLSLPFFLLEPSGYVEQVFRMHANRPPGRFSPIAFLYEGALGMSRQWPGTLPDDAGLVHVFSLLSFGLTLAVLGLLVVASMRQAATERALLFWSGLSLMGGLLATKVVSEQYILLPLGLLALAHWHPESLALPAPAARLQRFLLHTTTFVCIAALLDNVHFLLFLPDDVAQRVLGQSVPQTILELANFFHLTANELRAVLGITGAIGLVVPLWISLRLLAPALVDAFVLIGQGVHAFTRRLPVPVRSARVSVVAVFLLLMTPAVAVGLLAPKRDAPPLDAGVVEGPLVLMHYRTDWFNPTKRPEIPGGEWSHATLTPASGYYNGVAHKIAEDVALLRQGGVDAFVFTFDPAYEGQAAAGRLVAEEAGVPYALEVDLSRLASPEGKLDVTPETAERARELFNGPAFDYWRGGYHLRLASDAGNLLFLAGVDLVHPTFSDAERRHVADIVADTVGPQETRGMETASDADLWQLAPKNEAELQAPGATLWREAYAKAQEKWWRHAIDLQDNDTRLDLIVDADDAFTLPGESHVRIVGHYDAVGSQPRATSGDGVRVATVSADPTRPEAYAQAWSDAVRTRPHALLIPWNDFDAGQCIEPTLEQGATLLHLTERWAPAYRGVGLVPELPTPSWSPTPEAAPA